MKFARGVGRLALRSVYPQICPVCDRVLDGDVVDFYSSSPKPVPAFVCPECAGRLPESDNVCEVCGKAIFDTALSRCAACEKGERLFDGGRILWKYKDDIKEMLYRLKYDDRRDIAQFIGAAISEKYITWMREHGIEAIIPVPMHEKRLRERGYNQAELIALEISRLTGIPMEARLVVRERRTKPLKDMTAAERKNNLKNAFKIDQNIVNWNSILLVDDIYTTGSTVEAISGLLKKHGVSKVYFMAAASREDI